MYDSVLLRNVCIYVSKGTSRTRFFLNVTFSIGVSAFMFYYPQFFTLEFPIHVRGFTEVSSESYGI
jgi:hypothetical protein